MPNRRTLLHIGMSSTLAVLLLTPTHGRADLWHERLMLSLGPQSLQLKENEDGVKELAYVAEIDRSIDRTVRLGNVGSVPIQVNGPWLSEVEVFLIKGWERISLINDEGLGAERLAQARSQPVAGASVEVHSHSALPRQLQPGQALTLEAVVTFSEPGSYTLYAWLKPESEALATQLTPAEQVIGQLSDPQYILVREQLRPLEEAEQILSSLNGLIMVDRDFGRALAEIDRGLALLPSNPSFLGRRGFVLEAIGQLGTAQAAYEAALAGHQANVSNELTEGRSLGYGALMERYRQRLEALRLGKPLPLWMPPPD